MTIRLRLVRRSDDPLKVRRLLNLDALNTIVCLDYDEFHEDAHKVANWAARLYATPPPSENDHVSMEDAPLVIPCVTAIGEVEQLEPEDETQLESAGVFYVQKPKGYHHKNPACVDALQERITNLLQGHGRSSPVLPNSHPLPPISDELKIYLAPPYQLTGEALDYYIQERLLAPDDYRKDD